jgi:hypothetical protein
LQADGETAGRVDGQPAARRTQQGQASALREYDPPRKPTVRAPLLLGRLCSRRRPTVEDVDGR